ncbi:hypothetical protein [Phaeodactylibacter xiamenensis]
MFDYLKAGDTLEAFLYDFPSVRKEQMVELLTFFENFFQLSVNSHDNHFA